MAFGSSVGSVSDHGGVFTIAGHVSGVILVASGVAVSRECDFELQWDPSAMTEEVRGMLDGDWPGYRDGVGYVSNGVEHTLHDVDETINDSVSMGVIGEDGDICVTAWTADQVILNRGGIGEGEQILVASGAFWIKFDVMQALRKLRQLATHGTYADDQGFTGVTSHVVDTPL